MTYLLETFLEQNYNTRLREQIVEYKFLSELLEYSSSLGRTLEVARVEHDSFGYDVILKVDDVVKFVQLKSQIIGGKGSTWDVHKSLIVNPGGTVVLLLLRYSEKSISLEYRILKPANKEKVFCQNPKNKKDSQCRINSGDFSPSLPIAVLFKELFGEINMLEEDELF